MAIFKTLFTALLLSAFSSALVLAGGTAEREREPSKKDAVVSEETVEQAPSEIQQTANIDCNNALSKTEILPFRYLKADLDDEQTIAYLSVVQFLSQHGMDRIADDKIKTLLQNVIQNPELLKTSVINHPAIQGILNNSDLKVRLQTEIEHSTFEAESLSLEEILKPQELSGFMQLWKSFFRWFKKTPKLDYNVSAAFIKQLTKYESDYRHRVVLKSAHKILAITHAELFAILKLLPVQKQIQVYKVLMPKVFTLVDSYALFELTEMTQGVDQEIVATTFQKYDRTLTENEFWKYFSNPEYFSKITAMIHQRLLFLNQETVNSIITANIKALPTTKEQFDFLFRWVQKRAVQLEFLKKMLTLSLTPELKQYVTDRMEYISQLPEQTTVEIINIAKTASSTEESEKILKDYISKYMDKISFDDFIILVNALSNTDTKDITLAYIANTTKALTANDLLKVVQNISKFDLRKETIQNFIKNRVGTLTAGDLKKLYESLRKPEQSVAEIISIVKSTPNFNTQQEILKSYASKYMSSLSMDDIIVLKNAFYNYEQKTNLLKEYAEFYLTTLTVSDLIQLCEHITNFTVRNKLVLSFIEKRHLSLKPEDFDLLFNFVTSTEIKTKIRKIQSKQF